MGDFFIRSPDTVMNLIMVAGIVAVVLAAAKTGIGRGMPVRTGCNIAGRWRVWQF
jgi:hypothetical protein